MDEDNKTPEKHSDEHPDEANKIAIQLAGIVTIVWVVATTLEG